MKTRACWLLVSLWAGAGCINLSLAPHVAPKPAEAPVQAVHTPRPPLPPVTPEQVNEGNGHQMADALKAELDREFEGE